jgi:hypothetical protein
MVRLMESALPSPPVTRSLLELLSVDNVTKSNAMEQFVSTPMKFAPENTSDYMRAFTVQETLKNYLGR